jgi:hypothetical protein
VLGAFGDPGQLRHSDFASTERRPVGSDVRRDAKLANHSEATLDEYSGSYRRKNPMRAVLSNRGASRRRGMGPSGN